MTIEEQIALHEGLRLKPYVDTVGKVTIGYGRNLTDVGISVVEAMMLRENDLARVNHDLAGFSWWSSLDPVRRRVVQDLRFNLGPSRFREFGRFLSALERRDYAAAAAELQSSRWYAQVKTRGVHLVFMMETGSDFETLSI